MPAAHRRGPYSCQAKNTAQSSGTARSAYRRDRPLVAARPARPHASATASSTIAKTTQSSPSMRCRLSASAPRNRTTSSTTVAAASTSVTPTRMRHETDTPGPKAMVTNCAAILAVTDGPLLSGYQVARS